MKPGSIQRRFVLLLILLVLSALLPASPVRASVPCNDGVDNEGDGLTDYPEDPGCQALTDDTEYNPFVECDDQDDNDADGQTDYPVDPDCTSRDDDYESDADPACAFNGTNCDGLIIEYRAKKSVLAGAIGDYEECMRGRPILIKRRQRDGRAPIMRLTEAFDDGRWRTSVPARWSGRFFAVAPRWDFYTDDGRTGTCTRRESATIRIR